MWEKIDDLGHELVTYIDNIQPDDRFANLDGIADISKLMVHTNEHITFSMDYISTSIASTHSAGCHSICGEMLFSYECCEEKTAQ